MFLTDERLPSPYTPSRVAKGAASLHHPTLRALTLSPLDHSQACAASGCLSLDARLSIASPGHFLSLYLFAKTAPGFAHFQTGSLSLEKLKMMLPCLLVYYKPEYRKYYAPKLIRPQVYIYLNTLLHG